MKIKVYRGMGRHAWKKAKESGYLELDWQERLHVTTELWTAQYYAWRWARIQGMVVSFEVEGRELIPDEYGVIKEREGKEVEYYISRRIPLDEVMVLESEI